jgi:lipid-binding SYLF domain-containing protein
MLRPRHHCRCCGQLYCGACTAGGPRLGQCCACSRCQSGSKQQEAGSLCFHAAAAASGLTVLQPWLLTAFPAPTLLLQFIAPIAERLLLPPRFQQAEPQRVCRACHELLLPIQPLLAGSIAPAVRQPVHDVTDWSAPRSLLNPPLSSRLDTDVYTATNILRNYVRTMGSLPSERCIPPTILRGCAGLAILSVAKAGAGWSLSVGSGLVVARTPEGGSTSGSGCRWSAPSAVLSVASSVGWQLGVEVADLVLVLRSESALKAFCSGRQLGVGGSVSVAAGPVGRGASARAMAALGGGSLVYSYSNSRGAYAGVAVEASMLSTRDAVNQVGGRRNGWAWLGGGQAA